MTLRIGFAYNERPSEEVEPPGSPSHDRYAEWDAPDTIAAVEAALTRAGEVVRLEADAEFPRRLREASPDIVFNIAEGLEGPNREAQVPAICEFYGIRYTGSDPLTLCLALDKRRAKEAFAARGVVTPAFFVAGDGAGPVPPAAFPLPAFVKPLFEGSSKGIDVGSVCHTREAVERRVLELADRYRQPALVEEFLPGREFTCGVLGNGAAARVLPIVEIRFDALPAGAPPIYGWEAKWLWDTVAEPLRIFDCPAPLEPAQRVAVESAALAAYHALGCRDWGRVDVRLDAAGVPQVLEINPLPGILPDPEQNSCLPKAARAAGIDYDALILACLDAALERYGMRR
ncbi:MAG: D-alanine--D-alanine ligase family protein [Longimicrobiales bacterium]